MFVIVKVPTKSSSMMHLLSLYLSASMFSALISNLLNLWEYVWTSSSCHYHSKHMHSWMTPSWDYGMLTYLIGTKPLSVPVMNYYTTEKILWSHNQNKESIFQWNAFEMSAKCLCNSYSNFTHWGWLTQICLSELIHNWIMITACCKQLSEPMLIYCLLAHKEYILMKFYLKFKSFHSYFLIVVFKMTETILFSPQHVKSLV